MKSLGLARGRRRLKPVKRGGQNPQAKVNSGSAVARARVASALPRGQLSPDPGAAQPQIRLPAAPVLFPAPKFKLGRKMSGNFPLKLAWGGSAEQWPNPTVRAKCQLGGKVEDKDAPRPPNGSHTVPLRHEGLAPHSQGLRFAPRVSTAFFFAAQTPRSAFGEVGAKRAEGCGLPGGLCRGDGHSQPRLGRGEQPAPSGWHRRGHGRGCWRRAEQGRRLQRGNAQRSVGRDLGAGREHQAAGAVRGARERVMLLAGDPFVEDGFGERSGAGEVAGCGAARVGVWS